MEHISGPNGHLFSLMTPVIEYNSETISFTLYMILDLWDNNTEDRDSSAKILRQKSCLHNYHHHHHHRFYLHGVAGKQFTARKIIKSDIFTLCMIECSIIE